VRWLAGLFLALLAGPAAAEMVHRDNFRMVPVAEALERRAACGDFAGDPDRLVYEIVAGRCGEPGTRWALEEVGEVQVTRSWARLGYLAYQVLLLELADDSRRDEEWRFELTPLDGDGWQLDFAGQRWRCQPGRGSQELATQPCR
jgi:hypothetical protein